MLDRKSYRVDSDTLLRIEQLCGTLGNANALDDVRAQIDWCFSPEGDASLGVKLTAASAPIWFQSSFLDEYRERLEHALEILSAAPTADAALELQLHAALGDALLHTTGSGPRVTAAFNKTLQLAEQLGTTAHQQRALWGLWIGRIGASDYHSAIGFAEAFCLFAGGSGDAAALSIGNRMMALAHHFAGAQAIARRYAERALSHPAWPLAGLSDGALQFEHRVAAHAVFARILWVQGFPQQALRAGREALERARHTRHSLSLCYVLTTFATTLLLTGDVPKARPLIALLLDQSGRHSLFYWEFWGRCLEVALVGQEGDAKMAHPVLRDPLCSSTHKEVLATLNEGLATRDTIVRAENGLAGWCAAELLRVKAETLLAADPANAAIAEDTFQRSLDLARQQGALSWELRTATSLARLWHEQGRTRKAHDLLEGVYGRFTEGFETADLVRAQALLDDMTVCSE